MTDAEQQRDHYKGIVEALRTELGVAIGPNGLSADELPKALAETLSAYSENKANLKGYQQRAERIAKAAGIDTDLPWSLDGAVNKAVGLLEQVAEPPAKSFAVIHPEGFKVDVVDIGKTHSILEHTAGLQVRVEDTETLPILIFEPERT